MTNNCVVNSMSRVAQFQLVVCVVRFRWLAASTPRRGAQARLRRPFAACRPRLFHANRGSPCPAPPRPRSAEMTRRYQFRADTVITRPRHTRSESPSSSHLRSRRLCASILAVKSALRRLEQSDCAVQDVKAGSSRRRGEILFGLTLRSRNSRAVRPHSDDLNADPALSDSRRAFNEPERQQNRRVSTTS